MQTLLLKLKRFLLYGSSFRLRPYETAVLNAWREKLSPKTAQLVNEQLEYLLAYQRMADGKMLVFFTLRDTPWPGIPDDLLFPCRLSCVIAKVVVDGTNQRRDASRLRAEIHSHEGRLIYIEFSQPPTKRLQKNFSILEVEIVRDPMVPALKQNRSLEERREDVFRHLHSKLPEEYLQLVGDGIHTSINEWDIRPAHEISKYPARDGNYYFLAEKEGMGAVGVREDEITGQLYYIDQGDHLGEPITVGLRRFMEEFDGGKVIGRF